MTKKFDLIVIGTGEAGSTVAKLCRSAGWDVAVIDSRPFGGTCALRGCTPKKVLVNAAELIDWNHRMAGFGLSDQGTHIDWQALIHFNFFREIPHPLTGWGWIAGQLGGLNVPLIDKYLVTSPGNSML